MTYGTRLRLAADDPVAAEGNRWAARGGPSKARERTGLYPAALFTLSRGVAIFVLILEPLSSDRARPR